MPVAVGGPGQQAGGPGAGAPNEVKEVEEEAPPFRMVCSALLPGELAAAHSMLRAAGRNPGCFRRC